jgi:hypothetical protein
MRELGAAVLAERNLTVDGSTEPIDVAEMTASGFRIARVQPVLGRTLVDDDERRPDFPWPIRSGRRCVLSRRTQIRMPGCFHVFGRLAQGVSVDEAQAELTTVGQRMAAAAADTHAFLRPEIVPYSHLVLDPRNFSLALALANVFLVMLVVAIAADVALLMFARAASREVEIGVRSALGASRGRIVAQLFVEAVALSSISVAAGLVGTRYALSSFLRTVEADSGTACSLQSSSGSFRR